MTEPDPVLSMIAATFAGLDVEKSRDGYTLVDPRNGTMLAGLKPIVHSDRFELFYWSDLRGRWRPFGDFGRLRLTLERAPTRPSGRKQPFTSRGDGEAAIFR